VNWLIAALVAVLAVAQAWGVTAQTTWGISAPDRKLIRSAAVDDLTEIRLGVLATEKASNDAVKAFAQRMVADHAAVRDELRKIAEQKGVNLPPALDKRQQAEIERFSGLSGADFDRAYVQRVVEEHARDMKEFQRRADKVRDQEVRAWVAWAIPTIRDHLSQAEQLAPVVGAVRPGDRPTGF
jgi:putative membrane protein